MPASVKNSLLFSTSILLAACQPVEDLPLPPPTLQQSSVQEYYHKALVVGDSSQLPTLQEVTLKVLDDGSLKLSVLPYTRGLQTAKTFSIHKSQVRDRIHLSVSPHQRLVLENIKSTHTNCQDAECQRLPKLILQRKLKETWETLSTDWLALKKNNDQKLRDIQDIICRKLLELDKPRPLWIDSGLDALFSSQEGTAKLYLSPGAEWPVIQKKRQFIRQLLLELIALQHGVTLNTGALAELKAEKGVIFPQTQELLTGFLRKKLLSNQFLVDFNYLFGKQDYFGLKFNTKKTSKVENKITGLLLNNNLFQDVNEKIISDLFQGQASEAYPKNFLKTFKLFSPAGALNTELQGNSRYMASCEKRIASLFDITSLYANLPESPENTPIRFSSLMFFPFGNILSIHLEGKTSDKRLPDPFLKNKKHPSLYQQNLPKSSFNLLTISSEHTSFAEQIKSFLGSAVFADYAVRIFSQTKRLSLKNLSVSGDRVAKQGRLAYPKNRKEQLQFTDPRPTLTYPLPEREGNKSVAGPLISEWEFPSLEELILKRIYPIHSDTRTVRKDFSQVKPIVSEYSLKEGFSQLNTLIIKDMLPWGIFWESQEKGHPDAQNQVLKDMLPLRENPSLNFPEQQLDLQADRFKTLCLSYESDLKVPGPDAFYATPLYPCLGNTSSIYCSGVPSRGVALRNTSFLKSTTKVKTNPINCNK